jgi:hypothetical protein
VAVCTPPGWVEAGKHVNSSEIVDKAQGKNKQAGRQAGSEVGQGQGCRLLMMLYVDF